MPESIELTVAQIAGIARTLQPGLVPPDMPVRIEARPVAALPEGTPAEAVVIVDAETDYVLFHADPQGRVGNISI